MADFHQLWETTKQKTATAFREIGLFLSSMFFLKNFAAMIGLILLLLGISVWWLKCYTNHGQTQPVPELVDLPMDRVQQTIEAERLRYVVLDSIWRPDLQSAVPVVIDQNPRAAQQVKEGRTIYLTVTKTVPPEVILPGFRDVGYAFGPYQRMLKRMDIEATVEKRIFDPRQADQSILSFTYNGKKYTEKDIKNGLKIPRGSKLDFIITSRTSDSVVVPNLRCKTLDEVRFLLQSSNLSLGTISGPEVGVAYVWQTTPASGMRVSVGRSVDVSLQRSVPAGCN